MFLAIQLMDWKGSWTSIRDSANDAGNWRREYTIETVLDALRREMSESQAANLSQNYRQSRISKNGPSCTESFHLRLSQVQPQQPQLAAAGLRPTGGKQLERSRQRLLIDEAFDRFQSFPKMSSSLKIDWQHCQSAEIWPTVWSPQCWFESSIEPSKWMFLHGFFGIAPVLRRSVCKVRSMARWHAWHAEGQFLAWFRQLQNVSVICSKVRKQSMLLYSLAKFAKCCKSTTCLQDFASTKTSSFYRKRFSERHPTSAAVLQPCGRDTTGFRWLQLTHVVYHGCFKLQTNHFIGKKYEAFFIVHLWNSHENMIVINWRNSSHLNRAYHINII